MQQKVSIRSRFVVTVDINRFLFHEAPVLLLCTGVLS